MTNVKYLPAGGGAHGTLAKQQNIRSKLQKIIDCRDISQNFVFMCDDFYILKPVSIGNLSTARARGDFNDPLYREKLTQYYKNSRGFKRFIFKTLQNLRERGYYGWDGEIHAPRILNKKLLQKTLNAFDYHTAWASSYLNMHFRGKPEIIGLTGRDVNNHTRIVYRNDQKLSSEIVCKLESSTFLNHGYYGWNGAVKNYILQEFPNKGKYEKATV